MNDEWTPVTKLRRDRKPVRDGSDGWTGSGIEVVRASCARHLSDLTKSEDPAYRWEFSTDHADAICSFAEKMPHEKGALQSQRIRLEDWQVFVLASFFGWVDSESGVRKHREAFVLVPRGNRKSPLVAIIGLYLAFFDGEPGPEVYCGAQSQKQARVTAITEEARACRSENPAFSATSAEMRACCGLSSSISRRANRLPLGAGDCLSE